ncbi:MAG: hypothetical protein ACRDG9_00105, partial [Actinomycetota bacterium]
MMNEIPGSVETAGGAFFRDTVTAGTVIDRDQIIVINGFNGTQLEEVLGRLMDALGSERAAVCYEQAGDRLRVVGGAGPTIVLSKEAAEALSPVAARQGDAQAYLAALLVNPRFHRLGAQF